MSNTVNGFRNSKSVFPLNFPSGTQCLFSGIVLRFNIYCKHDLSHDKADDKVVVYLLIQLMCSVDQTYSGIYCALGEYVPFEQFSFYVS